MSNSFDEYLKNNPEFARQLAAKQHSVQPANANHSISDKSDFTFSKYAIYASLLFISSAVFSTLSFLFLQDFASNIAMLAVIILFAFAGLLSLAFALAYIIAASVHLAVNVRK